MLGRPRPPEIRLFFAVLLVAGALAVTSFGSSENRTLDLMRALRAGRLDIDSSDLVNNGDRASIPRPVPASYAAIGIVANQVVIERSHIYSGGHPGHAFVLLPAYAFARAALPEREIPIFLVIVGAALPLALGAVGMKRMVEQGTGCSPEVALATGAIHAFATLALPYGTRLYAHSTVVCFLIWSLGLLLERPAGTRRAALAGLLTATAVASDYNALWPGSAVFFFVLLQERPVRGALAFVAGSLPAVLGLSAYHTLCFGRPWLTAYHYNDDSLARAMLKLGMLGFHGPDRHVLQEILFGARIGYLTTQPIVLAGLAGLVLGARQSATQRLALGAATATVLCHATGYPYWDGCAFGARYSINVLPFVGLGMPRGLELLGRWRVPLAAASAFLAWVGTSIDWIYVGTLPWSLERIALTGPHTALLHGPSRMTPAGTVAAGAVLGVVFAVAYVLASPVRRWWIVLALLAAPIGVSVPGGLAMRRGPQAVSAALHDSFLRELLHEVEVEDNPWRLVIIYRFAGMLHEPAPAVAVLRRLALMDPKEKGQVFIDYEITLRRNG